jgi:hypothetical protein
MVYKFLFQLKDIPSQRRQEFIKKIESEPRYEKKVGETLIVLIDKLDDLDKPVLIGKLLKYVIEEKHDFDDFLRISTVIQKAFLPDLLSLKKPFSAEYCNPMIREHLITLGLVSLGLDFDTRESTLRKMSKIGSSEIKVSQKLKFELNGLGEKVEKFLKACA